MIGIAAATEGDAAFAWELYQRSIEPLAGPVGAWAEAQERRVVEAAFEDGEASLITWAEQRVGWLHVRRTASSLELWQIFVAPAHRGRGIGSAVLGGIKAQAKTLSLPILLAVLRNNPAQRLYAREGFNVHAEGPHHLFLWWSPPPPP